MNFDLVPIQTPTDWQAVKAIRTTVFIDEQRCPPEEEWDEFDASSHHLLGLLGDLPVACARWREVEIDGEPYAKLERFAVLREHRGLGLGRELVAQTIEHARRAGHTRFVLHAQAHLTRLYASFGFEPEGEPFDEAGIEHILMRRIS
jgi:predicted GNAT family N-acyltransferase